jgi:histone acetyltransferase
LYVHGQVKSEFNRPRAHPQVLIHLNNAKNVFSTQLPNMGGDYIARLVFDFHALTVIIFHDGEIKSAMCSRIFPDESERFIEIVFLAVDQARQMGGYGRLLMNSLKTYAQAQELYDFLTCADNEAVGFFKKQGFSDKAINMDQKRWVGRIKDYDKVKLMHCQIYPEVAYLHFQKTLAKQIEFLESRLGKRFHSGLFKSSDIWTPFPQAPSFLCKSMPAVIKLTDGGTVRRPDELKSVHEYRVKTQEIKRKAMNILRQLQADETFSEIFQRPVTEVIAPDYFLSILKPMDFQTIERRLRRFRDYYKRPEIFAMDIDLIVENCKQFNLPDTIYHKTATNLRAKFRQLYAQEFPEASMDK